MLVSDRLCGRKGCCAAWAWVWDSGAGGGGGGGMWLTHTMDLGHWGATADTRVPRLGGWHTRWATRHATFGVEGACVWVRVGVRACVRARACVCRWTDTHRHVGG